MITGNCGNYVPAIAGTGSLEHYELSKRKKPWQPLISAGRRKDMRIKETQVRSRTAKAACVSRGTRIFLDGERAGTMIGISCGQSIGNGDRCAMTQRGDALIHVHNALYEVVWQN